MAVSRAELRVGSFELQVCEATARIASIEAKLSRLKKSNNSLVNTCHS
jgi:hypothetical protein